MARSSALALALCALVLATSLASPLGAEPDPQTVERVKEQAKEHFDRGNTLLGEDALEAALAEFLRSRQLFASRGNTLNAAVVLRRLQRYDESLEMFEKLLAEFPNLPPEELAEVQREVEVLRTRIGALEVVTEAGATVYVDGRERGKTPLPGPISVSAGSRLVRIVKPGRLDFERRIEIAGRQALRLEAELRAVGEPDGGAARTPEPREPRVERVEVPIAPRLRPFAALDVGALVSPGLGGDLAARCDGACSSSLPVGIGAFVAGGVALSSGLDVGAELGLLRLVAGYDDRADPVTPVGYAGTGTANDELTLTGVSFGGTVALRTAGSVPLTFGFGLGVVAASLRDQRTGPYTATPNGGGIARSFQVSVEQTARGFYAYAAPEARVGFALSEELELSLGLEALVLVALSQPQWDAKSEAYVVDDPIGITQFSPDTLSGNVLLVLMPGVGARYVF